MKPKDKHVPSNYAVLKTYYAIILFLIAIAYNYKIFGGAYGFGGTWF